MTSSILAGLGWSAFFLRQLDLPELSLTPARIAEVQRDRVTALTADGPAVLRLPPDLPMAELTVGDWVLAEGGRILRRLDRQSDLSRRAAGTGAEGQSIAANVNEGAPAFQRTARAARNGPAPRFARSRRLTELHAATARWT